MKKILAILIVLLFPFKVNASNTLLAENAKSAIMLESTTGEIIFEKNSHERFNPASMTKMMSMLLIVEAIENNVIKWDDIVTISENASSMGGSQILLETNEKMSVEDLFKGVAIASGNDAVVALAEKVAGTESMFVKMMNDKAKELNLKDTNFMNPHGLDEQNHYSSAYDMSIIARELVKHEKVIKYTSIYEDYLRKNTDREIWLVNTNKLVRFYDGVDGLKTGYTNLAGYCLTATAKKDNMRIITVVMGEPDSKVRNKEVSEMLDYAYAQYALTTILKKNQVLSTIEIDKAKDNKYDIIVLDDINILHKKGENIDKKYTLKLNEIKVPTKYKDSVGKVVVGNDNEIDVFISKAVEKASLLGLYLKYLKNIFILS